MLIPTAAVAVLAASTGGSTGGGSSWVSGLLPIVLLVGVGYLLLIRPARARQRRALETRNTVQPGVEVTTTAGLLATVVAVDDDTVTLEVAPGVHSRYLKGAIARVHDTFEPAAADEDVPTVEPTDREPTDH